MSPFEQQVAEALLALPVPRRTHSVEVVKNILAPRVAAAIDAAQLRMAQPGGDSVKAWDAALRALRGGGDGAI